MNDTRPENFETIYEFLEEEEASVMTEGFQRPPPAAQHVSVALHDVCPQERSEHSYNVDQKNNKHNSRSSSKAQ